MNSKIKSRVKEFLIKHGSITGDQARDKCSTTRLSEYISRLRHDDGLTIKTVWVTGLNQFDEPCKWGKYVLIGESELL